jgi:WD40 repeat protein
MQAAVNPVLKPLRIASASLDHSLKIWTAANPTAGIHTEQVITVPQAHEQGLNTVTWDSTGRYVVTSGDDQYIHIWDSQNGYKRVGSVKAHAHNVTSVKIINEDADKLVGVSTSEDGTVGMWTLDVKNGKGGVADIHAMMDLKSERGWSVTLSKKDGAVAVGCDKGVLVLGLRSV